MLLKNLVKNSIPDEHPPYAVGNLPESGRPVVSATVDNRLVTNATLVRSYLRE